MTRLESFPLSVSAGLACLLTVLFAGPAWSQPLDCGALITQNTVIQPEDFPSSPCPEEIFRVGEKTKVDMNGRELGCTSGTGIVLSGAGARVMNGRVVGTCTTAVQVTGATARVENLTVQAGTDVGVSIEAPGVRVTQSYFTRSDGGVAIAISAAATKALVLSNEIELLASTGTPTGVRDAGSTSSQIRRNSIVNHDSGFAIEALGASRMLMSDNSIMCSLQTGASSPGISLDSVSSVKVSKNRVLGCFGSVLVGGDSSDVLLSKNQIGAPRHGIAIGPATTGSVVSNVFSGTSIPDIGLDIAGGPACTAGQVKFKKNIFTTSDDPCIE
jgi:hypothetical protein